MPSASGVYTLPPGYLAVTGATIQASQHNPPLEDIAAALTLRLSRDGSAPMLGPLQFAVGGVAAPGAVFATDPSSGLYKTTTGIGVAIGGIKVAEFTAAGMASGVFVVGMLFPYTCMAAPDVRWVLPFGQTLSRTTYAALWAQAQIEIAAGSLLYNNGDGSTTFGIMDMRGRVPAGHDAIGGVSAARLSAILASTTYGGTGGVQNVTLLTANVPPHTHSGTTGGDLVGHTHTYDKPSLGASTYQTGSGAPSFVITPGQATGGESTGHTHNFTTDNGSGTSTPVNNVQPVLITNYLLFTARAA